LLFEWCSAYSSRWIQIRLWCIKHSTRILISVLFFISLAAAVIEISYALSRPPGFNGHLIGIVLCTCCALLALLCVVKFAVYFSSPEQRAKVMPYMGFNTQAVVTSRARLGLSKN